MRVNFTSFQKSNRYEASKQCFSSKLPIEVPVEFTCKIRGISTSKNIIGCAPVKREQLTPVDFRCESNGPITGVVGTYGFKGQGF